MYINFAPLEYRRYSRLQPREIFIIADAALVFFVRIDRPLDINKGDYVNVRLHVGDTDESWQKDFALKSKLERDFYNLFFFNLRIENIYWKGLRGFLIYTLYFRLLNKVNWFFIGYTDIQAVSNSKFYQKVAFFF